MEDRSFYPFPKLPIELRLRIWKLALPEPRIVPLRLQRSSKEPGLCTRVWSNKRNTTKGNEAFFDYQELPHYLWAHGLRILNSQCGPLQIHRRASSPCNSPPAILLACKESFEIFSKIYIPAFGNESIPRIWLDLKRDTLYLDLEAKKSICWLIAIYLGILGSDFARVENLAVRLHCAERDSKRQFQESLEEGSGNIEGIIPAFLALKKLTLVSAWHKENMHNLVWMDMFNIPQELKFYKKPYDRSTKLQFQRWVEENTQQLEPPTILFDTNVDPQGLRPWFSPNHIPKPHFQGRIQELHPTYKVERKIITTPSFRESLNLLKARHAEEERAYRVNRNV